MRKGNPKNIHDWNDLVRSDVKLIFPNPKTSGNARYTYLAAWGAADKADGGDKGKTEQFMTQFLKNVEVFDTGGRGATTTFAERGLGDVLISFESEVNNIRKQYEAQGFGANNLPSAQRLYADAGGDNNIFLWSRVGR